MVWYTKNNHQNHSDDRAKILQYILYIVKIWLPEQDLNTIAQEFARFFALLIDMDRKANGSDSDSAK